MTCLPPRVWVECALHLSDSTLVGQEHHGGASGGDDASEGAPIVASVVSHPGACWGPLLAEGLVDGRLDVRSIA